MKLAILGTGFIVHEGALPALQSVPEIEVTAIFARPHSKEKADALAAKYAIPQVYTDYDELLSSTDVDFYEVDGFSFARIRCGYTFMEGKTSYPTAYVYLLRRDDEKHWKIYGWKDKAALEEASE